MADFNRFNQLLKSNEYTIIEYFSYHKYCNLVKVIHIHSGAIFFISLLKTYRLVVPENTLNHYVLTREDSKNREFTSKQLSDYYPTIELDLDHVDGKEDVTSRLKVSYKQPITIHLNTASEYLDQMKRLKYCFKTLEYKFLLQTDSYIINLNSENTIDIFKLENYPKTNTHMFYIVTTLEQFYSQINNIHDVVSQVESEFYGILDMNQQKHNQYLNTHYIDFFINNNEKLLRSKHNLHAMYKQMCSMLTKVYEKEMQCTEALTKIKNKPSHNIFRDAELAKQKEQTEQALKKIHEAKMQLLEKLLKLDIKIKNMYLVLDQLGFNLSLSFNELKNELYKMLT